MTTVRSSGRPKYATGLLELRAMPMNSFLRQRGMPGASVGMIVMRDRKYEAVLGVQFPSRPWVTARCRIRGTSIVVLEPDLGRDVADAVIAVAEVSIVTWSVAGTF